MAASTRTLLVGFLAVVAAFIGSTLWVQHSGREIDADAILISRDAAPGIEINSNLRAELRELEAIVIRAMLGRDTEAEVQKSRQRVDELLARALALPIDPNEAVLFGKLQAAIRAFDEAAERAMEQSRNAPEAQTRKTVELYVRPLANEATARAKELVEYDTRAAQDAAIRIEVARTKASRLALQLDGLAALMAIAAALIALRGFRQVQRVQAENHRLMARKAEELELFAGRVAHDIVSPLSAVGLALTIAKRGVPQAAEALVRGTASLNRVRGIVDGLLEFARAGARPEAGARVDVRPVVAGLVEELGPFADQYGAKLKVEPTYACAVACSQGVLLSLLGNLLRNAIKYLGEAEVREVSLRVKPRRGRVLFEVEDTGPGIPQALVGRVFELYVRGPNLGPPGLGLGLATVKRLAESHGGTVGLRPGPRGGSIFWFELEEAALGTPASDPGLPRQEASRLS